MTPQEYQSQCSRTECDQLEASLRIRSAGLIFVRLNHACIGMAKEAGELLQTIEKWIHYGANIAKLQVRFPDQYTDQHAERDNRDRQAEAEAVGKDHSFGE